MKWSHVAVLAPCFYFSRFVGITPLVARKNQDGILEFAAHGTLLAISILMTVIMTNVSVFMSIDYLPQIIKNYAPIVPYSICIVLSCYSSVIVLGTALLNHQETVRAFNEFHELSRQLMGHRNYNRISFEAFFVPISVVFITMRYIGQNFKFKFSVTHLTAYQYSYLICLSSQSLVTAFLFFLEKFFKCLNTELSEFRLNFNSTPTEEEIRLTLCRLKHLRKVHDRICDLCDIVGERFSLDIFIIFGFVVCMLLSTLYATIWVRNVTFMCLLEVLNLIHHGFLIFRLAHICYRSDCVMKQSEVTNAKVHSMMTAYLPAEIKQEIYHFTLQTMLRKVEITACGYYGIRMETITTLLYLITTYLVLVINLFEAV